MKTQTCCFTGHRLISADLYPKIQKRLEEGIINLISQGVKYFGSGGALGFDTLAALTVLSLKKQYPQIKLIMVLPCREQSKGWSEKDIATCTRILENADKGLYIGALS